MSTLPFDGFLDLLRSKGYGISLHEYLGLARLVERWDRSNAEEFGDALAAFVGRSEEEVLGIRQLFIEIYLEPLASPQPTVPPASRIATARWAWSIAAIAAAAVLAATIWTFSHPPALAPPPPVEPIGNVAPVVEPQLTVTPVALPPPLAPRLPVPPRLVDRRLTSEFVVAAFLLVLSVFWALKTKETTRTWLRATWASALAALPGPYHFSLMMRDRPARLPRIDVEEAATMLGRTFTPEMQARELDVRRSVYLTLRRGMMPQLVFKPRRIAQPILVFHDVSDDMKIWRSKVDALLSDLARQGVAFERWYFDGDPRRVADSPHRATLRFDTVTRRRPSSPVLIVSAGGGIESTRETGDDAWLAALQSATRRSWLTPVADLRLWPEAFKTLPLDVWPMTRDGLARAAKNLAGVEGEPADRLRSRMLDAGRVTQDDVERMKRLASVVPHPTTDLLEMLRRRFAPDISDAVVLHLLTEGGGPASPVIRLDDDELQRSLAAIRRETPRLEAAARRSVLDVLVDSQPAPGSAAYQRWQLSLALQQVQLAELEGTDSSTALETIRGLSQGPLWEEVRSAVRRVPASPKLARRLGMALGGPAGEDPDPPDARGLGTSLQPWSWPGVREMVPAAIAASIVLALGVSLRVFPARALDHVRDAYRLEYVARVQPALSELQVQLVPRDPTPPGTVNIFQDATLFKSSVALPARAPASISLTPSTTGHYYQVRAALPSGNLAVSNAVWVPSDTEVIVSIDAQPWANVSVQSDQTTLGPQVTPFSVSLVPGSYRLHFENNGVTPPMDQTIGVTPVNRVFRFPMPGFDPARTATELTRPAGRQ